MQKINKTLFQKKLSTWYQANKRKLPWRETNDSYKVWISEIMLQQTQVETVKDYYQKWVKKFPTVKKLSQAKLDDVLQLWAGLGYYRRARMIYKASQIIVEDYNGKLPIQANELMKLPGIGRYTAGAISSIAHEEKEAVLDGNVMRILTRIFAINDDISQSKTQKELWGLAETLLPNKSIGDFNQALMELGATVCFPKNPQCFTCPVATLCHAHKMREEIKYPVKKNRIKIEKITNVALALHRDNKYLVSKQKENARWGGLWMFPYWSSKKELTQAISTLKIKPRLLTQINHGYTKYMIQLDVYQANADKIIDVMQEGEIQWLSAKDLGKLALPSHHKKILKLLKD